MPIIVRQDDLSSAEVQTLIAEHLSGMHSNSPAGQVHALAIESLRAPSVSFWAAWVDGMLCGCGALKELDLHTGQAFEPAHALYRRNGFVWSVPFGEYTATDFNVFMAKALV